MADSKTYFALQNCPWARAPKKVRQPWTGLWAGRCGVRIPSLTRDLSILQTRQTHPASCSAGTGASFSRVKGRIMKLTTHLYLVPRLRISGAIPLPPIYALMPCTGTHVLSVSGLLCGSGIRYSQGAFGTTRLPFASVF